MMNNVIVNKRVLDPVAREIVLQDKENLTLLSMQIRDILVRLLMHYLIGFLKDPLKELQSL